MAEVGPLAITAHNRAQAEYLVRSRAQQRGIEVTALDAVEGVAGTWFVTVTVPDGDDARIAAETLGEDTQVLHFRHHPRRGG
jgi:hypothetical protein